MRILVFGAGGYIGLPLCDELVSRGHFVGMVDRWFFGRKLEDNVNRAVIKADTRTIDPVMFRDIDAVIDLAGLSNDASADIDLDLTWSINRTAAMRLADIAKAAGVKRYVYSSSCSVYGSGETAGLTEASQLHPLTAYAQSKVAVEQHLQSLAGGGFEPVILRNATVFGVAPRMRFDLAINVMTMRAWRDNRILIMGGGQQVRPFVHVSDVVQAFMLALKSPDIGGQTFNVGDDGMNYSIERLARAVSREFPDAEVIEVPDDPDKRSYSVSFAKIKRLGFGAKVNVIAGIREVRNALTDGQVNADDPTCYTTKWYQSLMDWDARLRDVRLDGKIL